MAEIILVWHNQASQPSLLCVFTFCIPYCDDCYDFRIKTIFGSSLPPVFVGELVSYLRYSCLLVSKTYCVVFLFCFSRSCASYIDDLSGLSIFDCPFGIL